MLKRLFLLILFAFSVLACRESHVEEVKSFRIYVDTDVPALKYSVQILVRDYNRQLGFEGLSVVDTKEDSTSLIHFRKGLANDGRKLGLGQWTTLQKQTVEGTFRESQTTTIQYGMDVIFDLDNFASKAAYIQDPDSDGYKHLFHLFCHEVGHGMQMDHHHDEDSVMFPSISEKGARPVNYDNYFQNVREFLNTPGSGMSPHHHEHDDTDFSRSDELKL
ncbi:MAG TPA: matrixin family metalloprotease [Oligoflexus sp.]|uniref:matrixin family metalloprotease n=1 Tax=Oligoflexus sp. TaxID=1971216 RepID=UPI002D5FCB80|nr:matrixin family metalloprotease [Oligoflexus sp.]HYX37803.1 matrixin family metalloprotease [Oligoflexus sp.]